MDPWSSSHPHDYPSLEQKLSCPGVSPGQGPGFLWADQGCWALTTETETDVGRDLGSLEMWVPNTGIPGEGNQRLGRGWRACIRLWVERAG